MTGQTDEDFNRQLLADLADQVAKGLIEQAEADRIAARLLRKTGGSK